MAKGSKGIGYWVMFQDRRIFVYLQRHAAFVSLFTDIYGANMWLSIPPTHTSVCETHLWKLRSHVDSPSASGLCDCTEGFEIIECSGLLTAFVCSPLGGLLFVSLMFGFCSLSKHAAFIKCGLLTQLPPLANAELTTWAHTRFLSHISQLIRLTNIPSLFSECQISSLLTCQVLCSQKEGLTFITVKLYPARYIGISGYFLIYKPLTFC